MFSRFRDEGGCCTLTTGLWPFCLQLRLDRDTGVLRILRPLRKNTTFDAAGIDGVQYKKAGAWYTEVYFTFWSLLVRSHGKTKRLLYTALRSQNIEKFTQALNR
jgi:hypothetical protein